MEFIENYTGAGNYTGSAVRVGAGVMFQDLYKAAWSKKNPVDVLGGECPVRFAVTESTSHEAGMLICAADGWDCGRLHPGRRSR